MTSHSEKGEHLCLPTSPAMVTQSIQMPSHSGGEAIRAEVNLTVSESSQKEMRGFRKETSVPSGILNLLDYSSTT